MFAYFQWFVAGENAFATITFGVVYAVFPFGKPAGYAKLDGSKKTCALVEPVVDDPDLHARCPAVASVGPQTVGAPISFGVRSSSSW